MKIQICIILIAILPCLSFAKGKLDLSESISESSEQARELSVDHRARAKQVRSIASAPRDRIVVVEEKGQSVSAPSDDSVLKYDKESHNFQASHTEQMKRFDDELSGAAK